MCKNVQVCVSVRAHVCSCVYKSVCECVLVNEVSMSESVSMCVSVYPFLLVCITVCQCGVSVYQCAPMCVHMC